MSAPPLEKSLIEMIREAAGEVRPELVERIDQTGADTVLFGRNGLLDSIGLVTLITVVEREIEDRLDAYVILADERAMSRKRSPFRTVGTLAEYAAELIREEHDAG